MNELGSGPVLILALTTDSTGHETSKDW
jgi:hypothetical protein